VTATRPVDDLGSDTDAPAPGAARPRWTFRAPSIKDPRLRVATVLLTVQALGQIGLDFDLSIAQILVSLGTAAVVEVAMTAPRTRVVGWPASALLTGNGVALLLRVPGTEHGDWWSLRGWYVFALATALAVLSKYVIRSGGRPLFNPSNFALVLTFLVLGSTISDPQDLWWGPMSVWLALTYLVVVVGGLLITRRLRLLRISVVFLATFAAAMAAVALTGHSISARWNLGPVEGAQYWTTLALSPEILIFAFFMITDPRTAARGRVGGTVYAVAVACASAVLVAFQTTEYATKVALLGGLVLVCAARPVIERWAPAGDEGADVLGGWLRATPARPLALSVGGLAVAAAVLVGAASTEAPRPVPAPGSRPDVELARDQRPAIELGPGLEHVGGAFSRDDAGRLVGDVVEDVLLVDRAVAEGDDGLAALVATGPFLEEVRERPAVPVPARTFETARIDVVRDRQDFQARPRLSIAFTGTLDGEPWASTYHVEPTTRDARIEREVPGG